MFNKREILQSRVERGSQWLDGQLGREGWLPNVDGENLNLSDGDTCLIGQLFPQTAKSLYSNFARVIRSGRLSVRMAKQRGFLLPKAAILPWTPTVDDYALLTQVWLDHMAKLKSKALVSPVQIKDLERVGITRQE